MSGGVAVRDCGRQRSVESSSLRLTTFELPAGYRMPAHAHASAGVALVAEGCYHARGERLALDIGAGEAALLPAGLPHRERTGATLTRCLLIEPRSTTGRTGWIDASPASLHHQALVNLSASLWRGMHDEPMPTRVDVDAASVLLMLLAASTKRLDRSSAPPWLRQVVSRLEQTTEAPPVSRIALHAGVSREHLTRTFRRHVGYGIGEHVRRARVTRAASAIRESAASLSAIATSLGFADQSHMTRLVRRYLGVTPERLRRRPR